MRNTYWFRNENNDIKGTTYIDIARTDPVANLKKIWKMKGITILQDILVTNKRKCILEC